MILRDNLPPGHAYQKCGIMLTDLGPEADTRYDLFDSLQCFVSHGRFSFARRHYLFRYTGDAAERVTVRQLEKVERERHALLRLFSRVHLLPQ